MKGLGANDPHASVITDFKVHNLSFAFNQALKDYPLLHPKSSDTPPDSALIY